MADGAARSNVTAPTTFRRDVAGRVQSLELSVAPGEIWRFDRKEG